MACPQCGRWSILCDNRYCTITGITLNRENVENRHDDIGGAIVMILTLMAIGYLFIPQMAVLGMFGLVIQILLFLIDYISTNGIVYTIKRPFVITGEILVYIGKIIIFAIYIPFIILNFIIKNIYENRYYILMFVIMCIIIIGFVSIFPPTSVCTHWIRHRNGTIECLN